MSPELPCENCGTGMPLVEKREEGLLTTRTWKCRCCGFQLVKVEAMNAYLVIHGGTPP